MIAEIEFQPQRGLRGIGAGMPIAEIHRLGIPPVQQSQRRNLPVIGEHQVGAAHAQPDFPIQPPTGIDQQGAQHAVVSRRRFQGGRQPDEHGLLDFRQPRDPPLELVQPVYGLMRGVPTEQPLASAYWRKRTPPPPAMDPDRDGCGLLWCAPVAPLEGTHATRLAKMSAAFRSRATPSAAESLADLLLQVAGGRHA